MRFKSRLLCLAAAAVVLFSSCAKETTESYDKYEAMSLEAYMTQRAPQYVVENAQIAGEGKKSYTYYVDVLDMGDDPDATVVSSDDFWIHLDFSGRDLSGNIIMTRKANEAMQTNTFTKQTHYVPYYRFCGEESSGLIEGIWVALRSTLHLSDDYFAKYSADASRHLTQQDVQLRVGSKVTLYLPSGIVGGAVEGDGGYEGQYSLSAKRPFMVTVTVIDASTNPLETEGDDVDNYCIDYGGRLVYVAELDPEEPDAVLLPEDFDDPNHPYNTDKRWVSACDTIPQLYVNFRYDPTEKLDWPEPYTSGSGEYAPYSTTASMDEINTKIAAALKERFDEDNEYVGADIKTLDADSVKLDGTAKIWYIGRFMDGFIFDTNIDEVKEIIYGTVASKGSALSYTPSSGGLIQAFYYTVPNLKFGQWAALITTSTYGYGATGQVGTSSSSSSGGGYSSSYYDYLNYMNYSNSYYGNSYYGGYYNNYYNNYYGGYYGNYGYDTSSSSTTTTTTVSTEILPYTPLIFQFYVEPKE